MWEVVNTNPEHERKFKFAVYHHLHCHTSPRILPGCLATSTVNLSFAPTATSGAASEHPADSALRWRSAAGHGIIFTINICRTILLYPYITNQAGFDTGLTVANTSQDPYAGTAAGGQAGNCKLT